MMGVALDGEMNMFCDNESVFKNSTLPESILKKKHNSIACHHTHEAQAVNIVCISWEKSKLNLTDLLTKLCHVIEFIFLCSTSYGKDNPSFSPEWNPSLKEKIVLLDWPLLKTRCMI